jgi:hypothetical protein
MPGNTSIRVLYNVDTDLTDWPKALPQDEREKLVALVRTTLEQHGPLTFATLERLVHRAIDGRRDEFPVYSKAALWDFLHACVERALRTLDTGSLSGRGVRSLYVASVAVPGHYQPRTRRLSRGFAKEIKPAPAYGYESTCAGTWIAAGEST